MTTPAARTALLLLLAGLTAACEGNTTGTTAGEPTFDEMRSVGEQYEPGSKSD